MTHRTCQLAFLVLAALAATAAAQDPFGAPMPAAPMPGAAPADGALISDDETSFISRLQLSF